MSDPKRYDPQIDHSGEFDIVMVKHPDGEFVRWEDYAALLATNERVCQRFAKTQVEANEAEAEVARLKAEVERLNDLANDPYRLSKGWRPIETAPKDGTDILCFCVEPEFAGEENPWTEFRVCFFGAMTEDHACWMSHYGYEQRPTHWMPLPKPPAL